MRTTLFTCLVIGSLMSCKGISGGEDHGSDARETAEFIKMGDSLSKITFDTLRTVLVKAIGQKGLAGALAFCNVQATAVTSTYSSSQATISRVADKNRNTRNGLSLFDEEAWEKYAGIAAIKGDLKPMVVFRNTQAHYYKPILLQSMCLNCHGAPGKEIPAAVLRVLDSLYPADKARGYKEGELRGMWHIVFPRQTERTGK